MWDSDLNVLPQESPSSPRLDVLNACAVRAQKVDRMIFWIRVTGRNAQDRIEVAAEEFNDVEWGGEMMVNVDAVKLNRTYVIR